MKTIEEYRAELIQEIIKKLGELTPAELDLLSSNIDIIVLERGQKIRYY